MAKTNKAEDAHNVTFYMRDDTKKKAEQLARYEGRSLSNYISYLIVKEFEHCALHNKQ